MTATKAERHSAILNLVNRGSVHTQQEIAEALAKRGMRTTQATISRDIQELGLVRSGAGYRSSAGLVREPRQSRFGAHAAGNRGGSGQTRHADDPGDDLA